MNIMEQAILIADLQKINENPILGQQDEISIKIQFINKKLKKILGIQDDKSIKKDKNDRQWFPVQDGSSNEDIHLQD